MKVKLGCQARARRAAGILQEFGGLPFNEMIDGSMRPGSRLKLLITLSKQVDLTQSEDNCQEFSSGIRTQLNLGKDFWTLEFYLNWVTKISPVGSPVRHQERFWNLN